MPSSPSAAAPAWRKSARPLAFAAACLAGIGCYAPALHAYFAQDDFTLLALARLLHQPWLLFYHDHFPGSLFFRPLGVFVWWLTTAWFDNAPRGHYAINLLLHLGCVGALYVLLQRLRRNAPLNAAWCALYAVHPLAIGTALWLSDRFDLIATTFSLLALAAATAWLERPQARRLGAVLVCVLVAFMGKEIAIVGALAAAALLALPNAPTPLPRRQRWAAAAAVLLLVAAWLGYRHALMTNPQNLLLKPDTLLAVFAKGIGLWSRIGFEYLVADPRQGTLGAWLLAAAAVLLVIALVRAARAPRVAPARSCAWGLGAALLILILLPGPTQAPVVAVSTADLGPQTFWFDLIGESRLYHLSLAGLIVGLMLLTTPRGGIATTGATTGATPWAAAALALLLAAYLPLSHRIAHEFARHTREQIGPLQAAHAAIAKLSLPAHGCQIYLLDAASIWGLNDIGDPTIKASAGDIGRLDHCLISTERTPWGHFVRSGSIDADDYRPLRPLRYRGVPIPWLVLDGFEAAYLDLDADIDARQMRGAFFLDYRGGEFVDVSAEVRSGARPVVFYNARPSD
jgi:hypothetical protein